MACGRNSQELSVRQLPRPEEYNMSNKRKEEQFQSRSRNYRGTTLAVLPFLWNPSTTGRKDQQPRWSFPSIKEGRPDYRVSRGETATQPSVADIHDTTGLLGRPPWVSASTCSEATPQIKDRQDILSHRPRRCRPSRSQTAPQGYTSIVYRMANGPI